MYFGDDVGDQGETVSRTTAFAVESLEDDGRGAGTVTPYSWCIDYLETI